MSDCLELATCASFGTANARITKSIQAPAIEARLLPSLDLELSVKIMLLQRESQMKHPRMS